MKIFQGLLSLAITFTLASADGKKTKKTDKTDVKRQIGYGLEAIPGVAAIHAPLAEEASLLAIGRTTAHGGYGVQPVGIIHNVQTVDNIGGFTSHGYDAYHGGFGVYAAPHAYIATPVVNVHKTVQLDQGWKGIDGGHGSIKHGHAIAQSLAAKSAVPVHETLHDAAPIGPGVPQFNYGKINHAGGYGHNVLIPSHSSFSTSGKGYVPIPNVKAPIHAPSLVQGTPAPKGYSFATLHGNPHPAHGNVGFGGHPSYQHNTQLLGHNSVGTTFHAPNHHNYLQSQNSHQHSAPKGYYSSHGNKVQSLINHGHNLAKNVHIPSAFGVNHVAHGKGYTSGAKLYQPGHGAHLNSFQGTHSSPPGHKYSAPTSTNNYHVPSGHALISPGHARTSSSINNGEYSSTHDAASRASSSYDSSINSHEHSDAPVASSPHTNGHQKATSFQSFIIHSYKPHSGKQQEYQNGSQESGENYSGPSYNSGQTHSSESHF